MADDVEAASESYPFSKPMVSAVVKTIHEKVPESILRRRAHLSLDFPRALDLQSSTEPVKLSQ
jgi:hypothetical protein